MSAYGHQAGRIIVHCTDGSTGLISHPSSEVHGPRLARLGDRGGIGSRHMYSFAGSGASVTGFGWTGGLVCTVIGASDGSGSTRTRSVMSAHVSEARRAARAGVIASSEWPSNARRAWAAVGPDGYCWHGLCRTEAETRSALLGRTEETKPDRRRHLAVRFQTTPRRIAQRRNTDRRSKSHVM